MNTITPDYGEPWRISPYETPIGESGDYEGIQEILTRDDILAAISWNPDMSDEARFERIVQCVNACAGIVDPVAEIQAMREALEKARHGINYALLHHNLDPEAAVEHLQSTLTKLQPFIKP